MNQNPENWDEQDDSMNIDWMALINKAWAARKSILRVTIVAAVVGVVVALCTPRTYNVTVTLAPEVSSGKSSGGGLSSLASMMGLGGMSMGSSSDALNVMLYPNVVSSTPFLVDLFGMQIQDIDEKVDTTLYGYMTMPKGFNPLALPGMAVKAVVGLFQSDEEEEPTADVNPFRLTREQAKVVAALRTAISADVDKKTGVTTVSVVWNDPLIAATVADSVCARLQEHITAYRTRKAEDDLAYFEKLTEENRLVYERAQQACARYQDSNRGLVLQSVRSEQVRLENEMSLAFQVYNQMAQQKEMAKAKVQEAKPAFAIVEPASVPLRPMKSRKTTVLLFMFLGFAGSVAWYAIGKEKWAELYATFKQTSEQK